MSGHVGALLRHVPGHSIGRNPHGINEAAAVWLVEMAQLGARHVCVRESLKKNVSTPHVGSTARARLGFLKAALILPLPFCLFHTAKPLFLYLSLRSPSSLHRREISSSPPPCSAPSGLVGTHLYLFIKHLFYDSC